MQRSRIAATITVLAAVLIGVGPLVQPSAAIDISFHLEGPGENPAWDPDGSILRSIFEAAASYWEPIFVDSRSMTVDIEWDDDLGTDRGMWTYDPFGNNNIEINSNLNWWVDPTPLEHSEFDFATQNRNWNPGIGFDYWSGQWLYQHVTSAEQLDWFNGAVPGVLEVGYRGNATAPAAVNVLDLLSTCIHELGHELGIRSDVGDVFPLYPHQVGGATDAEVAAGPGGHIAPRSSLMCNACGYEGMRRLPSAVDILAIAHAAGYTTLNLPRTEFINVNSNFSSSQNWVGGMSGTFNDATVRHGNSVVNATASADMNFVNLTLLDDSWVSTGNRTLNVAQTLTIDAAGAATDARLSVDSGGTVAANRIRLINGGDLVMYGGLVAVGRLDVVGPFTGQFAMLPGATLRVDRLTGFGDNLQFLGNLQIGDVGPDSGQLDVGLNQSLWVLGAMTVGPSPGGSGSVTVLSGAQVDTGPLQIGSNSASGFVTLSGYNSSAGLLSDWDVNGDLTIGSGGIGTGTMTVQLSATVDVTGAATVRGSPDAAGRLIVRSAGQFEVAGRLNILPYGTVQMTDAGSELIADEIALSPSASFSDGPGTLLRVNRLTGFGNSVALSGSLEIGQPGGLASHTVSAGRSLTVAEHFTVGKSAPGQLDVAGTVASGRSFLAATPAAAGSVVTVRGAGARWDVQESLYVGGTETLVGGAAALVVSNFGQIDVAQSLSVNPGSIVTVGAGDTDGTLTVRNTLHIYPGASLFSGTSGNIFADALDLAGGGTLNTSGNSRIYINRLTGIGSGLSINGNLGIGWSGGSGTGNVAFSSGQQLSVSGVLYLGEGAAGTLSLANGGTAQVGQARIGNNGGSGTLIVTRPSSALTQNGDLYVGYYGSGTSASLRIDVGGAVLGNGRDAYVGSGAGTTGTALVTNPNSSWSGLNALYVGGNSIGAGGTGTLIVSDEAEVSSASTTIWSSGTVHLDDGVLRPGSLNLAGGRLEGVGNIVLNGALTNGGIMAPGNATGLLSITNGNYVQSATGVLAIDLGGISAGQFDRIEVHRANAALAGGLQVSLVDGFLPRVGNSFDFLWVEETLTGAFNPAMISYPVVPGVSWNLVKRGSVMRLQAVAAVGVPGDYNNNGVVDAADYASWRDNLGSSITLPNDLTPGAVTQSDYDVWKTNFGRSGAGAAAGRSEILLMHPTGDWKASVPEPTTLWLLVIACGLLHRQACMPRRLPYRSQLSLGDALPFHLLHMRRASDDTEV